MALIITTTTPQLLLEKIVKEVSENKIRTWSYDGTDFTHTTSDKQWDDKAWMRPSVVPGVLIFGIVARNDEKMSKPVYGVYHGRFTEMLLTHFDKDFTSIQATALLDSDIDVYK